MSLLLREAIGGTIRRARTQRQRTLRDVSGAARVSLGYLSEIERGRKEPSSELLAAICEALALPLPDLLDDVADALRPVGERTGPRRLGVDPALRSAVEEAFEPDLDAVADEPAGSAGAGEPAAEPDALPAGEVVDSAALATGDGPTARLVPLVAVAGSSTTPATRIVCPAA